MWLLQVLLTKTKAWLHCESMSAKQMGGKLFQGVQVLGKSGRITGVCYKMVPLSIDHLNGAQLWGAMKLPNPVRQVGLQIEENLGQKVTGSKLCASKESLL